MVKVDAWAVAIAVTVGSLLASMACAGAGCMGVARALAAVALVGVAVALPLSQRPRESPRPIRQAP